MPALLCAEIVRSELPTLLACAAAMHEQGGELEAPEAPRSALLLVNTLERLGDGTAGALTEARAAHEMAEGVRRAAFLLAAA